MTHDSQLSHGCSLKTVTVNCN